MVALEYRYGDSSGDSGTCTNHLEDSIVDVVLVAAVAVDFVVVVDVD